MYRKLLRKEDDNKQNCASFNFEKEVQEKKAYKVQTKGSFKTGALVSRFLKKDKFPERTKKNFTKWHLNIYAQELKVSITLLQNYGQQFLLNHDITFYERAKMLDWIDEVLTKYQMSVETYFLCIQLLDRFFQAQHQKISVRSLHKICVTCIWLGCKYQQVSPLSLETVTKAISHGKFNRQQIIECESEILKILKYKIPHTTIYTAVNFYSFSESLFGNIYQTTLSSNVRLSFKKSLLYLSKLVLYERELLWANRSQLAMSIVYLSAKIANESEYNVCTENQIKNVLETSSSSNLKADTLIEISRKILKLAQNFKRKFPQMNSLKNSIT